MTISVVLTAADPGPFASALTSRLRNVARVSEVRSSPVVESWDGLTDVCRGAGIVYLLSALDLPDSPTKAKLREFRAGVSRVLECCQECGVSSLVFLSSSRLSSSSSCADADRNDSSTCGGSSGSSSSSRLGVMRQAEAEVLKARQALNTEEGTQNLGEGVLYTCALRPGLVYGAGKDEPLLRALSWMGWGLNRVTLRGLPEAKSDMIFFQNLIDATVLAGTQLTEGAAGAQAGGAGWSTRKGPVCSGQSYCVTDGQLGGGDGEGGSVQPGGLQAFMDGVLEGLVDFTTSKVLRLPVFFALAIAWAMELVCKMKLAEAPPSITRSEVRKLVENRCSDIERARRDLGYEPRVDRNTALRTIVEDLKRDGWGRHTLLVPGLGYWICIPLGIWLNAVAAFKALCPAFLAPVQRFSLYIHLAVFRKLWIVRLVCVLAILAHVLEGWYAFVRAKRAGHGDTAPRWLIQTLILGYPSTRLVMRLLS
ncbi:unnamed protein product [Ectocarpus sp. 12 AP-2014]